VYAEPLKFQKCRASEVSKALLILSLVQVQVGKRAKSGDTTRQSKKLKMTITSEKPPSPAQRVVTPNPRIGVAEVGQFVALRLAKYDDEIPQIAKVVRIDGSNVTVEWWMGSFSDNWREWKEKNKVIQETFHRNAIIKSGITFTASKRLPQCLVEELKKLYEMVELF